MTSRVLIIGGYGNFGSYIAEALAPLKTIQLVIAGRSKSKAEKLVASLNATNQPLAVQMDIGRNFEESLQSLAPDIVIHTSGPFQGQDHFVAKACLHNNCHYIDLADGRDFVSQIDTLNQKAKNKSLTIVSGASSVPCLSSCLIDHYINQFSDLRSIDYGITTAQRTNRGLATTAAILSYVGKPFATLHHGRIQSVFGWQNLHRHHFKELGSRLMGNCDIPDLTLFPKRYPPLKSLRFYAGLEIPFLHVGLWGLSWLVRVGLIKNLNRGASTLLKASFLFDRFGSDTSAFYMRLQGTGHDGKRKEVCFDLTARSGHGPFIPCMPAILIAKKLANGELLPAGAMACVGLITLKEYLNALKALDITWTTEGDRGPNKISQPKEAAR